MKILNIIIPERMKGHRIDASLSEMLPDYSRSKITTWIKSGDALINQKTFKPKDKANGNETVFLTLNQKQSNDWIAEKIPLKIVYEDEDIIIIKKSICQGSTPISRTWMSNKPKLLIYHDNVIIFINNI